MSNNSHNNSGDLANNVMVVQDVLMVEEQQHDMAPLAAAAALNNNDATAVSTGARNNPEAVAAASKTMSFYAVLSCCNLKRPAIFTSWDDAEKYCTQQNADWKVFSTIQDAVQYLQQAGSLPAPVTTKKRKSTTTTTATASAAPAAKRRNSKRTLPTPGFRIKQSEFDKIIAQLGEFKQQYHHVNVPGPFSKKVPLDEKFVPLSKTMAMIRQAVKQYPSEDCSLTDHQMNQLADIGFVPRSLLNNNKKRRGSSVDGVSTTNNAKRWQTPTSAHNLLKLKSELEETWDDRIALLKEYKQEQGHANVPRRPNKSLAEKYLPLCKFAGWMSKFLEEYHGSSDGKHFFLTADRVKLLEDDIGFTSTSPQRKVNARKELLQDLNFDDMLVELKRVREGNLPVKTNRNLEFWIAEQRKEYALFKNNQPSSITPEKVVAMAEAGFPFEKMKSPTWDERAVEWLEFKTRTGRDPMREESLYQWVYKQRVKYKQKMQGGKKNNLTEEQIKRLTDWGFNWEMKFQFPNMAKPVPWEERYEQLVKYKEENGNCQVHKNVAVLGQWVKQQRKEYRYFVQGSKPSRMTQERIAKLSAIGFDFGEKRWNTGKMKTAHAAIEKGKQQDQQQAQEQLMTEQQQQRLLQGVVGVPRLGGAGDSDNEDGPAAIFHHDGSGFPQFQPALAPWDGYRTFNNNPM